MSKVREILMTDEFDSYYSSLSAKVREKYDYVLRILETQKVVNAKFVKHLEDTELYELRVSLGSNEYRTILFAVDGSSFVESSVVVLLNSFLKKGTKQYRGEIERAYGLLKDLEEKS